MTCDKHNAYLCAQDECVRDRELKLGREGDRPRVVESAPVDTPVAESKVEETKAKDALQPTPVIDKPEETPREDGLTGPDGQPV